MSAVPVEQLRRADRLEALANGERGAGRARRGRHPGESEEWPDPADLSGVRESLPYPTDAFPEPARSAILEYQRVGRQPMALVGSSALGQMALAAQGLADVARDYRLISPVSLNLLVIAESGERKSAADKQFGRAARAWLREQREARLDEHLRATALEKDRLARMEGIRKKITSLAGRAKDGDRQEQERLQEQLIELEQNPIAVPPLPLLFYEDVTPAALAYALAIGWPSAGLFSDEGGAVVGSHGMQDDTATALLSLLNILWDGRDYVPTRKQAAAAELRGRRFSAFLMLQPDLLPKLIAKGARGIGFFARFLLSAPDSTMGGRFYVEPPENCRVLDDFDAKIRQLLDAELPVDRGRRDRGHRMHLDPPVMVLDPKAKGMWVEYHDAVERELCRFGEFAEVKDVAAKSAENAVRIAGIFQLFDQGRPGRMVEPRYMEGGIQLAVWHLAEARRLFFEAAAPQNLSDARELSAWLRTRALELTDEHGQPIVDAMGEISLRDIQRLGPNRVRDSARRDAAIEYLEDAAHLRRTDHGKQKRARINPKLLPPR